MAVVCDSHGGCLWSHTCRSGLHVRQRRRHHGLAPGQRECNHMLCTSFQILKSENLCVCTYWITWVVPWQIMKARVSDGRKHFLIFQNVDCRNVCILPVDVYYFVSACSILIADVIGLIQHYLRFQFNLDQIYVGLLFFAMAFGYVVAAPVVGRVTDKWVIPATCVTTALTAL